MSIIKPDLTIDQIIQYVLEKDQGGIIKQQLEKQHFSNLNNAGGRSVSPRSSQVKKRDQLKVRNFIEMYKVLKMEEIKNAVADIENAYDKAIFEKLINSKGFEQED